jgi:hypothetical protein
MKANFYSKPEVDDKIEVALEELLWAQNQLAADVMNVGNAREMINAVRIKLARPMVKTEMEFDDGAWAKSYIEKGYDA